MKKQIFWIFGLLQSGSLAFILFLIFDGFNSLSDGDFIGRDSQVVLSIAFPLFLLLTEYMIYERKG